MLPIEPWARKYIGIPFVKKGRSFEGIDCYGLHWLVEKTEAGIELPTFEVDFNVRRTKEINQHIVNRMMPWEKLDGPEARAAVLLIVDGVPAHIGVMVGPGVMMHVDDEHGSVVAERLIPPVWPDNRIEGYYAYRGVSS